MIFRKLSSMPILIMAFGLSLSAQSIPTTSVQSAKDTTQTASSSSSCPGDVHDIDNLFPTAALTGVRRSHFVEPWQRDFVAITLDMTNGHLYWYDYLGGAVSVPIPPGVAFMPTVYTKEKMFIRICNAHFATAVTETPVNITVAEAVAEESPGAGAPAAAAATPAAPAAGATPGAPNDFMIEHQNALPNNSAPSSQPRRCGTEGLRRCSSLRENLSDNRRQD